jgi:hypothetical protein
MLFTLILFVFPSLKARDRWFHKIYLCYLIT